MQGLEHLAAEGRADEPEIDGQLEPVLVALQVAGERVACRGELAVGADDPRSEPVGNLRKDDVLGLLLEGDTDDPARPLDDQETADRSVETGEDRVGESLADGGGGDGFEQGIGQGSHAACLSRRLRTAVETRWRAASGEQPSRPAMCSYSRSSTKRSRSAARAGSVSGAMSASKAPVS